MKTSDSYKRILKLVAWAARLLAVGVFLFWGGFFVEHLQEWFIAPHHEAPPLSVWIGQTVHLLLLVGLIVVLRWPVAGSILVVGTGFALFFGRTGANFPLFFLGTSFPALLLLFCRWQTRKLASGSECGNSAPTP